MVWDVVASAALPLLGGLFGSDIVGDTGTPGADFQTGIKHIEGIGVPTVADQIVNWENLAYMGDLAPAYLAEALGPNWESKITADPSVLRDLLATDDQGVEINRDPRFKSAMTKGLDDLRAVAEGGFSVADQAAMEEIRRRVATEERGQREALLQRAQERGVGGSGLEMASALQSQQDMADRRALENLMTAARGEERRVGASQAAAGLGSQFRGQEFGEAKAMDDADRLINQFNAQMRMRQAEGDTNREMAARQRNVGERQRLSDMNTQGRYQAALRNKALMQQKFDNEMRKGEGMMAGYGGKSGAKAADMDRKYRLLGGGLGGAGNILGDYFTAQRKQKNPSSWMSDYMAFENAYNKKKKKNQTY
jgi:hypothetical protein